VATTRKKKQIKTQKKALGDDPLLWMKEEDPVLDNDAILSKPEMDTVPEEQDDTMPIEAQQESVPIQIETPTASTEASQKDTKIDSEMKTVPEEQDGTMPIEAQQESVPIQNETPTASTEASPTDIKIDNELVLEPILTIAEVEMLHKKLQDLLQHDGDIQIDASKVQMIDTAGLQLLLVFNMALQKQQKSISWITPSPTFQETAALIGLSSHLGLNI